MWPSRRILIAPFFLCRCPFFQVRLILDRLFYTHRDLFRKQVATRPYDLATAIDVLALGTTFARFPRYVAVYSTLGFESVKGFE